MRKGGLYLNVSDSIGVWKPTKAQSGTFTNQIAKAIGDNFGKIQHINVGWPGTTTQDLIKNNFRTMGSTFEPDLLTMCFGINDANASNGGGWGVVPTATFKTNITAAIDHFKKMNPSVHIILCSAPTIDAAATPTNAAVDPYRVAMAEVAASKNVSLCQLETAWTTAQVGTYVNADKLHPNDSGHLALFNLIWPIVQTGSWLQSIGK